MFVCVLQNIDLSVKKETDEATKYARNDQEITLEELTADVYNNPVETQIRNVLPWNALKHIKLSSK